MGSLLLGILACVLLLGGGIGALPGLAQGAAFDEQEYFDTFNTANDWTNWQPTDANGNPNGTPGSNGWLMTRNTSTLASAPTLTPSAGTGPTSVHSGGTSGGFLFLENSGTPPWPDRYFTRKAIFDASKHNLNVSFAYAMYGAGMGTLQLQVNDGSGWVTEWQQVGNDGNNGAWTTVSRNLFNGEGLTGKRYYGNSVRLRFRFVSGSTFAGDAAIDTLRVFGPEACTETATVSLNNLPSPITAATPITATLAGVGGNTPQVSTDGVTWSPNGWTYVPPVASTGMQTFYARATGFCGTYIYDPFNPTTVRYDTTCTDPSPSTINVPVGQVVTGTVNLASLFTPTGNVGAFTYKINGAAVNSTWDSSAYGLSSPEVVTLKITGTDPECGGNTLVKSAYITVDNTCIVHPPTFGFDRPAKYADAGASADFLVTVYNNDVGTCAPDTFTVSVVSNSQPGFTGTITGTNPLVIAPGAAAPTTLRVTVPGGAAEWLANVTTVRVDAASHADPANLPISTTVYREIPLLHNSIATDSDKHGGKWGTSQPGAKYGKFTCDTCHQRGTTNIKRVRTSLAAAPNTTLGDFPGSGASISFLDARDGSAEFGDDSRADKSQSNRICEVCHTYDATQAAGVNKHAFNMTAPGASTTHYNKQDCTVCHDHQNGFRAGCTACHGDPDTDTFWPDSTPLDNFPERLGAHTVHVEKIGNYIASGDKDNNAFTTPENRNASCGFCHPDAGGSNVDGGSHMENTAGSPANVGDVHGDGFNSSYFKALDGSNDVDGNYNPTIKRCSNIDCHSNGKFTWAWYGDVLPPAAVTNLAAGTGSEIGTVALSWTAPGNDNDTAGKAYRYEVRYSTSAIANDAAWNSATIAGGVPTAKWPGSAQTMTVYGLNPGTTYYFAVKTADEVGNWSALSAPNPSAVAKADTLAPVFRGLETAVPVFATGEVNLGWPAATDHSLPIEYRIWWRTSDLTIDYNLAPNATTSGLSYNVSGLTNGTNYNFAVRARDAVGNTDTNTVQKEVIPQTPPEKDWLGRVYYAGLVNGATCGGSTVTYSGTTRTGTLADAYTCGTTTRNTVSSGTSLAAPPTRDIAQWTTPAAYVQTMNITGGSLRIYVRDRSSTAQQVTITLGYADNSSGANFQALGSEIKNFKRDFRGMTSVNLSGITGQIPAGKYLSVKFSKSGGGTAELQFRYASERYRSELTVYEQVANARPNAFSITTPAPGTPAGAFDIQWSAAVDPDGDPVKYNVYGVLSNGTRFVIARNTALTTASWDTVKDGIGLSAAATGVVIKVEAFDGLNHNEGGTFYDHREATSATFDIDNRLDVTAPAAVTDLAAEHRPKAGSVYLYWTAPGDDGLEGKGSQYDIRYSTSIITEGNFAAATQVSGEPVPGEPGLRQGYEVLGLDSGQTYYFALKTADEVPNWSGLSNVPAQKGGPSCGVCHSTPPDEAGRAGTHDAHGYTQVDCAKCHGFAAVNFGNNHSDGKNDLAFNNPKKGFNATAHGPVTETANRVTYHSGGTAGGVVLYDDTSGGGGFNDINPGGDDNDNGSCFGFNATGVTGCHGAAGSDPDGAGPLPTYPAPVWGDNSSVSCAMCHGDPNRADATPFKRPFEDGSRDSKFAGNVKLFKAAPGIDLLGNASSNAVGQHLVHLNFSYRFTGDSCALCHLNNEHADGTVDVQIDKSVAGANVQWNPNAGGPGTPGTCSGTSELRCHGNNASPPEWKVRTAPNVKLTQCNECHGFSGKTFVVGNPGSSQIPHVKDGGQVRDCTWCHVEGHPREGYSISAATKANPVKLTSARHGLETGDTVTLHMEGMTQLNRYFGTVTVVDANNFTLDGVNSTGYSAFTAGHWKRSYAAKTITAITKANPAAVTSSAHGLATGDNILLKVSGMTQLDRYYGPVTVVNANSFTLDGVNSTAFGNFTSGSWVPDDGTILVPNYSIAGIDYSSGGIHLKRVVNGRSTLNSGELVDTEAETCWACHEDQAPVISEWGVNQKSVTGNMIYDYGSLNKVGWYGATWTSANFAYKTSTIQSTHSVNPSVLAPGADTDDLIRCSYCHDVHDLNKAVGDTVSGTPYLRGTWKGNPYKEDGAPGRTAGYTTSHYTVNDDFGAVPRGGPGTQKMGGYWIDQNSGYPTASWTLGNSAGLCTLCHGIDINNMNKFGNAADAWIGPNGHSNAAIGGSSIYRTNIYNPAWRKEGTTYQVPGMGYQDSTGQSGSEMHGLRAAPDSAVVPYVAVDGQTDEVRAYQEFNWGVDREVGTATADSEFSYHRFSCSKCHNPHASRLPRLMITNCLDISHNTWDNDYTGDTSWSTWSARGIMPYSGNDLNNVAINKQLSYATSASNCHRYVESGKAITGITKANPAVVTSTAHGLTTGTIIKLKVAGMTQLDNWQGSITVLTANTFSLDGVNSTAYGTFSSGRWWGKVEEQGWNKLTPWRE